MAMWTFYKFNPAPDGRVHLSLVSLRNGLLKELIVPDLAPMDYKSKDLADNALNEVRRLLPTRSYGVMYEAGSDFAKAILKGRWPSKESDPFTFHRSEVSDPDDIVFKQELAERRPGDSDIIKGLKLISD